MSEAHNPDIVLTIPTYRSADIAKTVSRYAKNFRKFGHNIPIAVFDDSDADHAGISEESLRTASILLGNTQQIFYIGPHEKRDYLEKLKKRFGSANARTIERIFRPSYGGNRNFILAYTIGRSFVSVDDDMKPEGLFINGSSAKDNVISRGRFLNDREAALISPTEQDIMKGYLKFLGTTAGEHQSAIKGHDVKDSNVDPQYGLTLGNLDTSVITAVQGEVPHDAVIKIVQTHLCGAADIDSEDLVKIFIDTGVGDILSGHLPKKYVIKECREAVTSNNSRLTGALLGYDNSQGGIYFLPTAFRCEDFIWRVHLENRKELAAAYTEHAQTHARFLSVRNSVAKDWFNELIAQIVKRTIRKSVKDVHQYSMTFHKPEPVSLETARGIESIVREKQKQAEEKAASLTEPLSFDPYLQFVRQMDVILNKAIYSTDAFAVRLTRIIENEFRLFNRTAELWPSILEYSAEIGNELPVVDITQEAKKESICENV